MSGTPWDQSHRSMQINSPLGANQVAVLSMVANEPCRRRSTSISPS